MNWIVQFLESQNKYSIQYRSLHLMLLFGTLLGLCATLINATLNPSVYLILLPLSASFFCALLFVYSQKGTKPYISKIAFIIFFDFVYFPLGWITSSGSLSSMPYYSILFLIATFLLIEYSYEYIFPTIYVLFAIFLMYAEVHWPGFVISHQPSTSWTLGIGFHYAVVTVFIGVIYSTVFQRYMNIQKSMSRQYVRDELTGLYSRSYGTNALRKAFEISKHEPTEHTLVLVSVSGLKSFNSQYNSTEGDDLVITLAKILQRNTRSNDICSRYDGNLFLIILNHASPKQLESFLARINGNFNQAMEKYVGLELKLLVGTAGFDYNDISDVLRVAEQQLEDSRNVHPGGINA